MAWLLGGIGALSLIVLAVLLVAFGRRVLALSRSLSALQAELTPALEAIQRSSEETKQLSAQLEQGARVLRRDGR